MTDDERKAAEDKRRRELLILLLALLIQTTSVQLDGHVAQLVDGKTDTTAFGAAMLKTLASSHATAGYLGRTLAGSLAPFGKSDVQFGELVTQTQSPFVRQFVQDLDAKKYTDAEAAEGEPSLLSPRIYRRASLYARRLRGTANEAWLLALPQDTLIHWRIGGNENHCDDCPELEADGPYRAQDIPTVPGAGDTECMVNCLCYLETDTGEQGFPPYKEPNDET
jgi:hypothetical protein